MEDVDIVIVGAGAAGLAAARTLRTAGLSFRVLEAMDRIGGRAWTSTEPFGIPFDIGCAWLHAADRNPFYDEARSAGWTLHHHDLNVDHLYFGRRRASESEIHAMRAAETAMGHLLEGWSGADDRVAAALAAGHAPAAAATYSGPMDFAQDFDEMSIEDYRGAADLDPNYFTREGFGALVARWGSDVPVHLSTPVQRLDWSGPGVDVVTDRGTIRARRVIVTASPGALAHGAIDFHPLLPDPHMEAIYDLPMGMLTKLPVEISGTRLGLAPFEDLLVERHGHHDIYFLCFPFDCDLMVGFVGGDFAWEMSAAGEAAGVDFAVARLVEIFGADVRRHVGRSMMTAWGAERYVRGAYAAARPGSSGARRALSEPVADRLWFAGEALAGPLMQTCGGARLSGEAVAAKVVASLQPLQNLVSN